MRNRWMLRSKSIVALLLIFLMVLSFTGCKKEDTSLDEPAMVVVDAEDAIKQLADDAELYGYENALSELTEHSSSSIDGDSYYRLQQNYQGIPVYGQTVVCATDENGNVSSLTGNVSDITTEVELTPTIKSDQVEASIRAFYMDEYGYESNELNIDNLASNNLCIYIENSSNEVHLAYCICVGAYEFIIDAHSGKILSAYITFYENNSASVDGWKESDHNQTFPVEKYSEKNYIMYDSARNLKVFTLNHHSSGNGSDIEHSLAELVQSADNIFGNTEEEITLEYEKGAALYQKAIFIHDYFDVLNFSPKVDSVYLYYNDRYDNGENALGGVLTIDGAKTGVVSMGSEREAMEIVGHEYTHYVSRNIVNWRGGSETEALDEAMSDLFGEFIESAFNSSIRKEKVEPDWVHGDRYMINPSDYEHADHIDDSYELYFAQEKMFGDGEVCGEKYYYSTIVSHAAYLMWNGIDGTEIKKISTDDLEKLWYRAMLMMPADCDFSTCRQLVEWAALAVDGMTDAQRQCIAEAFDTVGIYAPEQSPDILIECDQNIVPDAVLNVYNVEGKLHPRYTVEINGTIAEHELAYSTNIISDAGFSYEDTRTVRSAKPLHLDLPDGYYTFKITDKNNPQYEYIFTVSVSDQGTEEIIELHTDFEDRLLVHITETETEEEYEAPSSIYGKQLVRVNTYSEDSRTTTYQLQYNEKNQLIAASFSEFYGTEKTYGAELSYEYDANGRLIKSDCGGSWQYFANYEYEYNEKGQKIRTKEYWGDTDIPYRQDDYEYDSQGNLSKSKHFSSNYDTGKMELNSIYSYTYVFDSAEHIQERHRHVEWIDHDFTVSTDQGDYPYSEYVGITGYTYDSDGRILTENTSDILKHEYSPQGNQAYIQDAEDTTSYCYDYAPYILRKNYSFYTLSICDSVGTEVWGCKMGDVEWTFDDEGYIIAGENQDGTHRVELIYDQTDRSDSETEVNPDLKNLVTDVYTNDCTYTAKMYNYETGKSENTELTCTFHIPQINLPGHTVESINSEIYDSLFPIIEEAVSDINEYGYPGISGEVSYSWAVNGDILSLVINNYEYPSMSGGYAYTVYNISISSGSIISDEALIKAAGLTKAEFKEKAKQVLGSSFWGGWDKSNENFEQKSFVDFFNEQLRKTISDDNVADVRPYINEKGQLCMIARQYSLAAGDWYWHDLNMVDFEFLDYYADEATLLSAASGNIGNNDSAEYSASTFATDTKYNVGDSFLFGSYEQDGNTNNGTEPILWRVLDCGDGKLLVISEKAIECKQFHSKDKTVTWENSDLRHWLNNDFYLSAFSESERKAILLSNVSSESNPQNSIDPGANTTDYVFIPCISEMQRYFSSNSSRKCIATQYAISKGAFAPADQDYCTWWLLRNPGEAGDKVANVNTDGRIDYVGSRVESVNGAVRLMMWINIDGNGVNASDTNETQSTNKD